NVTVTTTVRNLSSGNLNWTSSVTAVPGDIVQYNVSLTTAGSVNNVTVKDALPANLLYKGSLMIDETLSASDMTSGVNIGSISNSQTRTLQYQAQVASAQSFPFGTTTLTDAVTASGSNMNAGISSASVVVTRSGVLGASSVSTGLTNNPL